MLSFMKKESFNLLVLAALCLCLTLALLGGALFNVKKTEGYLLGVYRSQGHALVKNIELSAQNLLKDFRHIEMSHQGKIETFDVDFGFEVRENLFQELLDLLLKLDNPEGLDLISPDIEAFLYKNRLLSILILDDQGNILRGTTTIPKELGQLLKKALKDSFDSVCLGPLPQKDLFFVGRKAQDGSWTLLLLDRKGIDFWAIRASLKIALQELWKEASGYIRVLDPEDGMVIWEEGSESPVPNLALLEISSELFLDRSFIAQVGLDISDFHEFRTTNRYYVGISTALMASFSLFLVIFFYMIQQRYLRRVQEMKDALAKEEKLSSLGKLAKGLAHEIRNPLNAISMALQRMALEFEPEDSEKREEFREIGLLVKNEVKRLTDVIEAFVGHSRQRMEFGPQDLVTLMEGLLSLVREEIRTRPITVDFLYAKRPIHVWADYFRLYEAFLNILKNSVEAMPDKGRILVELKKDKRAQALIIISDTGKGIPQEDLDRIFEPGYTTKEKGLGLGLAIAREIIKAHGGDIKVWSRLDKGTTFYVTLPVKE